jgi:hypothetical protein
VAIVVLLVLLNWFVHKVYRSEWIGRRHRQRRSAQQLSAEDTFTRQAEAKIPT